MFDQFVYNLLGFYAHKFPAKYGKPIFFLWLHLVGMHTPKNFLLQLSMKLQKFKNQVINIWKTMATTSSRGVLENIYKDESK